MSETEEPRKIGILSVTKAEMLEHIEKIRVEMTPPFPFMDMIKLAHIKKAIEALPDDYVGKMDIIDKTGGQIKPDTKVN